MNYYTKMVNISSHYPVLYLEETDQGQIDWRVFVRYDYHTKNYVIYGTRRPKEATNSSFPYYRMIFTSRSTLARWLMWNLHTEFNDINFTMYNFDLKCLSSEDFVGYNELRRSNYETLGINVMGRNQKTYQSFMTYLRMLRDVQ